MYKLLGLAKSKIIIMLPAALFALLSVGCASTVGISETYVRPPEIDMRGKKTVVLESEGGYQRDASLVTSKLKQALLGKQFTVADRDSMDAKAREQFFGDDQSATIAAASVLIRVNVLSRTTGSSRESDSRTNYKDDSSYTVYRTVGKASTEVSFDVVDLGTTKLMVSKTLTAGRTSKTDWDERNAGNIDTDGLLSQAYDDVVSNFMRKIAPYTVTVEHDVYSLGDDFPRAKTGASYLQGGMPDEAYEEFNAALNAAKNNPEVKPKNIAQIMHNMAVAKEQSGNFDEALQLYIDSTRYEGAPDQAENIKRTQMRIQDQEKLKEMKIESSSVISTENSSSQGKANSPAADLDGVVDGVMSIFNQ